MGRRLYVIAGDKTRKRNERFPLCIRAFSSMPLFLVYRPTFFQMKGRLACTKVERTWLSALQRVRFKSRDLGISGSPYGRVCKTPRNVLQRHHQNETAGIHQCNKLSSCQFHSEQL